jgi:hypothetical protein
MGISEGIAWFFGGLFAVNSIPHFVAGVSGKRFQSPFAKPPGEGLSSAAVNAIWGSANAILAYVLLLHVGEFDLRNWAHFGIAVIPALALGSVIGNRFGRFNGGNLPASPDTRAD